MTEEEGHRGLVKTLAELCKIDSALAGIMAERKRSEKELSGLEAEYKRLSAENQSKGKLLADKKNRYQKEERELKEESQKLVTRRKALGTLANRKTLEKAEQEISFAARQLEKREDVMLSEIEGIDKLEAEQKSVADAVVKAADKIAETKREMAATFINLEERESEYLRRRAEILPRVDENSLVVYERLRERYLGDAVTPVKNGSCASCYMQVAPQLMVNIARSDQLVKCRGCGRILYVEEEGAKAG